MTASVPGRGATLTAWLEAIASPSEAPAGGTAAAVSGSLAAATIEMVAAMTLARGRYAEVHPRAREVRHGAARLREAMLALARKDAETFAEFTGALALPKASEAERSTREAAKRAATLAGAEVQLELLGYLAETADLSVELAEHGLATALGDSASAGFMAAGAARCAYWAVRANLQDVRGDPGWSRKLEEGLGLLERVEAAEWRVRQLVNERIR